MEDITTLLSAVHVRHRLHIHHILHTSSTVLGHSVAKQAEESGPAFSPGGNRNVVTNRLQRWK